MTVRMDVLRRGPKDTESRWQTFDYEPRNEAETVATALRRLNAREDLRDSAGNPARPIRWEHSCLQKKCGACAMVINGRPGLACDARLMDYGGNLRLEPLRKFPVVEDLMVDRSILQENLRQMKIWLEERPVMDERSTEDAYDAARCLQCGCCLEVCPNCIPGETFAGMAGALPAARILAELPEEERKELAAAYRSRIYEGCGKSLACRNICPAGIDIDRLLASSNAAAVWRRPVRRKKEKYPGQFGKS
ncbi:MAG: succinate dehydrogenase [Clostridium sp.]|nr:succinate dehydrogenase [Clostridium sp.]MBO6150635.1 succinate dehydrogenase [Clostridium sp.]